MRWDSNPRSRLGDGGLVNRYLKPLGHSSILTTIHYFYNLVYNGSMLESYKNNRIHFNKKNLQRDFILKAQQLLGFSQNEFAQRLKISQRTLADWTREKITISQASAEKISKMTGILIPKDHSIVDWHLRFQKAGKVGGRNKFLKYGSVTGDERYRKEKWEEWWKKVGQYKKNAPGFQSLIKIKIPRKSRLLAEFIGIMLGDGNISPYHIGITLSSEEKEYIQYVENVIAELFDVMPKKVKHKSAKAVTIVVNRRLLVNFCQQVGFEMGNKVMHQIDIPTWIKNNKVFSRECIRGLFDTDGCFFLHRYISKGKKYSYLKIAFTSASLPLLSSVAETLINFGFNVRISKNHKDVQIEDSKYVLKFINEIGSHNFKHLEKIKKWKVAGAVNGTVC